MQYYFGITRCLLFLLIFILYQSMEGKAQKEQNVWIFGMNHGVDFNSPTPRSFIVPDLYHSEGCATVCDADGQLLFYTQGSNIWDRNLQLMPGGSLSDRWSTISQTQAAVIAEVPGQANQYYVFSNVSDDTNLYISIVDMRLNNGLGDVASRDTIMVGNKTEKMSIVNGTNCNFWLVMVLNNGIRYSYEINSRGINRVPVQSIGGTLSLCAISVLCFSPDGSKMALVCYNSGIELFDFNPATGVSSNPKLLERNAPGYYGACFSPDNSKLYVDKGNSQQIIQFDLSQADIAASKINIVPPNDSSWDVGQMKLGPDNRIYHISRILHNGSFSHKALDAIMYPNLAGTACEYKINAIPLAYTADAGGLGLPNEVGIIRPKDSFVTSNDVLSCFADVYRLQTPEGSFRHQWNTGATTASIHASNPGTYVVSYMVGCVYYRDSFHVTVGSRSMPELNTTQQRSCTYLANDTAILTVAADDTDAYTYRWYDENNTLLREKRESYTGDTLAPIGPGMYQVVISSASGCDTTLSFSIAPPEVLSASFETDSFLCEGLSYSFVNNSSGNVVSQTWLWGDGDSSTLFQPEHAFDEPGNYQITLVVQNSVPCYNTFQRSVVVDSLPVLSFTTDQQNICAGQSVLFEAISASNITSLAWRFNNGDYAYTDEQTIKLAFDDAGIMPVTIKAQFRSCPEQEYTDTVYVHSLPLASIGEDTSICLQGASIMLGNKTDDRYYKYLWNTGDTSAMIAARHYGLYYIIVTDPYGCVASDSVEVSKDCYIDIPNVFTPNGDGRNDYFLPKAMASDNIISFHLRIYSRWGQLVFEQTSLYDKGWDGKLNGKDLAADVYVYLADVLFQDSRVEKYQGNISLVR